MIRYVAVKILLRAIRGSFVVGAFASRALKPIFAAVGKAIHRWALSGALHIYFVGLKIRRRAIDLSQTGVQNLLVVVNKHLYHVTLSVVVIIALLANLTMRRVNAETIPWNIPFSSILPSAEIENLELIDEGPLSEEFIREQKGSQELFAEDLTSTLNAPDTDDVNEGTFATTEDETAIISPVASNGGSSLIPQRDGIIEYAVEAGDTISTIAEKFGITQNTILWQNNLSAVSTIRAGQSLAILPASGVAHTVKSGETIGAIAKKYQADAEKVVAQNKLADAGDIQIGEILIVPDGIKPTAVVYAPRVDRNIAETIHDIFVPPSATDSGASLLWPLISTRITQYFHYRHSGIDIGDKLGNPIYAAEAGKVERSGWTSGYGYNVVINHGSGLKTLYGHSSKLLVSVGDTVARGDTIALIGSTGRSTGPHLHFEVISSGRKINPLNYLK